MLPTWRIMLTRSLPGVSRNIPDSSFRPIHVPRVALWRFTAPMHSSPADRNPNGGYVANPEGNNHRRAYAAQIG